MGLIMRHQNWRTLPPEARGGVYALGNFDGVHRGHAHLIHAGHAARPDLPLGVVTFEPHPRALFRPEDPPFRLTQASTRAALLAGLGVRHVIEIGFDAAFAELTAEQFVTDVLHGALDARHLVCGLDFAFGHRRGGDSAFLAARAEALGIGLTLVPALTDASGPISSSRVRRALQDGYPERAAQLLGRPWAITGVVSHGDQRGRTIGFPTANIPLGPHLEPQRGVYAVTTRLDDGRSLSGVANLGRRPTVADTTESRLEAHFFDFAGDLYCQELAVSLHAFIRPERRFDSFQALRDQIVADAGAARGLLDQLPPGSA
jgi:riboflavin kinase/FMN adenylyltransferase